LFQPSFCPFPCGQPFRIRAEIQGGEGGGEREGTGKKKEKEKKIVLRTNKGVQHLLVREVPTKGKSWEIHS